MAELVGCEESAIGEGEEQVEVRPARNKVRESGMAIDSSVPDVHLKPGMATPPRGILWQGDMWISKGDGLSQSPFPTLGWYRRDFDDIQEIK